MRRCPGGMALAALRGVGSRLGVAFSQLDSIRQARRVDTRHRNCLYRSVDVSIVDAGISIL